MDKRVLITGGAGYIASHTEVELLNRGYEVIAFDNMVNSCDESIKRVETITGKKIKFYKMHVFTRTCATERRWRKSSQKTKSTA